MKKTDVKVGATYRAKVSDKVVEVRIDAESPHGGWDATNLATGKKVRIKTAQRLRPNVGAAKAAKAEDATGGATAAPAAKEAETAATAPAAAEGAPGANVGQRGGKRGKGHKVIRGDGKVVHVSVPGADETPPGPAATNPAVKATEKARREAIKVADANLAAIEAAENGTTPKGKQKGAKGGRSKPDFSKAVKPTFPKPKRTSALDAAAQVLAKAKEPMTCKAIVAAMAEQGLWSSPGGKTPTATVNAAILKEIQKKRKESRFIKAGRGLFAANPEGGE